MNMNVMDDPEDITALNALKVPADRRTLMR